MRFWLGGSNTRHGTCLSRIAARDRRETRFDSLWYCEGFGHKAGLHTPYTHVYRGEAQWVSFAPHKYLTVQTDQGRLRETVLWLHRGTRQLPCRVIAYKVHCRSSSRSASHDCSAGTPTLGERGVWIEAVSRWAVPPAPCLTFNFSISIINFSGLSLL